MKLRFVITFIFVFFVCVFQFSATAQMRQVYLDTVQNNNIESICFYSPSEGYVAFRDWIGFSSDSGKTFIKKPITLSNVDYNGYSVNLTFGFGIKGVKAFNKNILVVYGDYGFVPAILYSNNGGTTYKLVFHSLYTQNRFKTGITDMVFPENNIIGYAVDADRILKTEDGGLSWFSVQNYPDSYFDHLEAVDNSNLVVFSTDYNSNKLLKTTNAGSNWQTINLPAGRLTYAYFRTPSKGWLSILDNNYNGRFYSTADGGITWSLQNNPEANPFACGKMRFLNDTTGFSLSGQYTVQKTTDGGKVWEPLPRDNSYTYLNYTYNDLQVWSVDQLWAGGGQGFLEVSNNGGGVPLPKAFFLIDTTLLHSSGLVHLNNYSNPGYQFKWYKNDTLFSTSYHATYPHSIYTAKDTIMLIVSNGINSDTLIRYQSFDVPVSLLPTISTFTPGTGPEGTVVTITGTNLSTTSSVRFGGVDCNSFQIISNNEIRAVAGSGASGDVSVTTSYGTASKPGYVFTTRLVIQSFSPQSGPAGTLVTITGTNFSSVNSENIVYFGGVRSEVIASSPSQLQVKVPFGATYQPVSVTVGGLTAYSTVSFVITFSGNCTFDSTSLGSKIDSTADVSPTKIGTADLDGDGKPDVILEGGYYNRLSFYRNQSTSNNFSLAAPQFLSVDGHYYGSAAFLTGDINGDGKLDITTPTGASPYGITVFKNASTPGSIDFTSKVDIQGDFPAGLALGDLNGDGKPEVFGLEGGWVEIYKNTSTLEDISLVASSIIKVGDGGGSTSSLAAADVDGDGKTDVLVGSNFYQHPKVSIFKNNSINGSISFTQPVELSLGNNMAFNQITLGDVDHDGRVDVIAFQRSIGIVTVFRNLSTSGNVSFDTGIEYPVNINSYSVTVGDLTGDGLVDLVVSNYYDASISVLVNRTTNNILSFDAPINFGIESYPFNYDASICDLDLDGKPDVATMAYSSSNYYLRIFKNQFCGVENIQVCAGKDASFTSSVEGTNYQWQENRGNGFQNIGDSGSFSGTATAVLSLHGISISSNRYQYRCMINDTSSKLYILLVEDDALPTVTIQTQKTTVCSGVATSFYATALHGGNAPSYQWQVNGVNVGTNSPVLTINTLQTNDTVRVLLTSSALCVLNKLAVSNSIYMTVTPRISPNISISSDVSNLCSGSRVTFSADVNNAGNNYKIDWKVNSYVTGNGDTLTTTSLPSGDVRVEAKLYISETCTLAPNVTSNVIAIKVNPLVQALVNINSSASIICPGTSVRFEALPVNAGTIPSYLWQVNGNKTGDDNPIFTTDALKDGDSVQVLLTSSASCVSQPEVKSNLIKIQIPALPLAYAGMDQTICAGGNGILLGSAAVPGMNYSWSPSPGLSVTNVSQPLANPTQSCIYYLTAKNVAGCEAKDTVSVFVQPQPIAPTITMTGNVITSSAVTGNRWYFNGNIIAGATEQNYTATNTGIYTVTVTQNSCVSIASNSINYVVAPIIIGPLSDQILMGPNPVEDYLLVQNKVYSGALILRLQDMQGRLIKEISFVSSYMLDMKGLGAGTYVIQIINNQTGEHIQRMIIKQ